MKTEKIGTTILKLPLQKELLLLTILCLQCYDTDTCTHQKSITFDNAKIIGEKKNAEEPCWPCPAFTGEDEEVFQNESIQGQIPKMHEESICCSFCDDILLDVSAIICQQDRSSNDKQHNAVAAEEGGTTEP